MSEMCQKATFGPHYQLRNSNPPVHLSVNTDCIRNGVLLPPEQEMVVDTQDGTGALLLAKL